MALALLGILTAHALYLITLAWSWDLAAWLPQRPDPTFDHPYVPPDWEWSRAVATWFPWNLPAWGGGLHAIVAAVILRYAPWTPAAEDGPNRAPSTVSRDRVTRALWIGGYIAAILLPLIAAWTPGGRDLAGKRILAQAGAGLDWRLPEHGQYGKESAGVLGMLPAFAASLGGQLEVVNEIADEQLRPTDLLLLVGSSPAMTPEATQRIWKFVREGGSLLVVASAASSEAASTDEINRLLAPTRMRVRRDLALSACDDWKSSGQDIRHPALGRRVGQPVSLDQDGSSIELGWAAHPLAIGRWGWSDPGNRRLLTGGAQCEPGERLGDLVLAAEQRIGSGTVVLFGTERPLTNEGLVRGHSDVARLLDYLVHRPSRPTAFWRQLVTLGLLWLLIQSAVAPPGTVGRQQEPARRGNPAGRAQRSAAQSLIGAFCANRSATLPGVSFVWMASVTLCLLAAIPGDPAVPDGKRLAGVPPETIRGLAYIDASHLEPYSNKDWVFDGTNGLALNLMRNGYLTLSLPEWSSARLQHANLLVSMAPGQEFSRNERSQIRQFVSDGGLLICMVGAEQARASASLLSEWGMRVAASPVPTREDAYEPEPMGHIRSLYLNVQDDEAGDYRVGVVLHAAWPLEFVEDAAATEVLVRGNKNRPVIVHRSSGDGSVVVIGDSAFGMNKNLEYIGGEPFNGRHENAHFWRWLLARVTRGPRWVPPRDGPIVESGDETSEGPTEVQQVEPAAQPQGNPS